MFIQRISSCEERTVPSITSTAEGMARLDLMYDMRGCARRRWLNRALMISTLLSLVGPAWADSPCESRGGTATCAGAQEQQLLPLDFGASLLGSKLGNPHLQSSWNHGCLGS